MVAPKQQTPPLSDLARSPFAVTGVLLVSGHQSRFDANGVGHCVCFQLQKCVCPNRSAGPLFIRQRRKANYERFL